jgi:hypothetical protein
MVLPFAYGVSLVGQISLLTIFVLSSLEICDQKLSYDDRKRLYFTCEVFPVHVADFLISRLGITNNKHHLLYLALIRFTSFDLVFSCVL